VFRLDLIIQNKVVKQDFASDMKTAKALRKNYARDGYIVSMYNGYIKNNKGEAIHISTYRESK